MAKPLTTVVSVELSPEEREAAALASLRREAAADAEALEAMLRVVRGLHERGLLELTAAVLEQGEDVLRTVVELLAQPGAVRILQNVIAVVQVLGALDVQKVGKVVNGAMDGLDHAVQEGPERPLGLFGLIRSLSDPDVSTGLTALLGALKGMGAALRGADQAEGEKI
jgi:uncharacterized protein YjgD (DUF1641 family)